MATYKDLQRVTGLSLATISKYYNGGTVRPQNRAAIEQAASELGFQINDFARSLRRGSSRTVGVLLPALDNAFHLAIIAGVERLLRAEGMSVIVCSSLAYDGPAGSAVDLLRSKMVDGIVAVPSAGDIDALARAESAGLPVVTVDRTFAGLQTDHTELDNLAAGAMAAHHLADHRHTRIGLVGGDDSVPSIRLRAEGFTEALRSRGIDVRAEWLSRGEPTVAAGRRAVQALLARGDRPTALFSANYELTVGALIALNESGLRIPIDISVVGFDVEEIARVTAPRLTTVVQPMASIAEHAARKLLERMSAPAPVERSRVLIAPELLIGGSVTPPSDG